jgi:hypothetical protein
MMAISDFTPNVVSAVYWMFLATPVSRPPLLGLILDVHSGNNQKPDQTFKSDCGDPVSQAQGWKSVKHGTFSWLHPGGSGS